MSYHVLLTYVLHKSFHIVNDCLTTHMCLVLHCRIQEFKVALGEENINLKSLQELCFNGNVFQRVHFVNDTATFNLLLFKRYSI